MYRTYENPRELEAELKGLRALYERPGHRMTDEEYSELQELEDRVNFAWQDEEADIVNQYEADMYGNV